MEYKNVRKQKLKDIFGQCTSWKGRIVKVLVTKKYGALIALCKEVSSHTPELNYPYNICFIAKIEQSEEQTLEQKWKLGTIVKSNQYKRLRKLPGATLPSIIRGKGFAVKKMILLSLKEEKDSVTIKYKNGDKIFIKKYTIKKGVIKKIR